MKCGSVFLVSFPRATMKSLIQTVIGTEVSQNMAIAKSLMAKVLDGRWWEGPRTSERSSERSGEAPPLQPKHRREEAVLRLRFKEQTPTASIKKTLSLAKARKRLLLEE